MLKAANDPDDEIIPAVPAEPRTRLGDIWILGEHRLGCGDGRDMEFPAAAWSARAPRSMPRSSIHRTMCGSTATPMPRAAIASSPWPPAR